ncbi:MAG: cupin domain-containing protein [Ginsengibacter sp.]
MSNSIFDVGDKNDAYAHYFEGQSYLKSLVADPGINVGVGTVTFEPGYRNNWHIHRNGFQILLITGGEGWYQEEGKTPKFLTAGDVIVTHDGIKHWHGATKDGWFDHIAITSGSPVRLEPVDDERYNKL